VLRAGGRLREAEEVERQADDLWQVGEGGDPGKKLETEDSSLR
jgi:hypothetical protein